MSVIQHMSPPAPVIDARRLLAFVHLARTASFAAAARQLSLTSSAISHSIRTFEEECGTPLFHRHGHKAVLTSAGRRLLPRAETILREMTSAHLEMNAAREWGGGELRICAPASICRYILPPALCEFREDFPDCTVAVQAADTDAAHSLVAEGHADLAVGVDAGDAQGLQNRALFVDQMHLYVSPHHPLASSSGLRNLASKSRFIVYSLSSLSGRQAMQKLKSAGVQHSQIMEIGSQEAILEMARIGIGAAVLSSWVARHDAVRGLIKRVPGVGSILDRKWSAWSREGEHLPVTTHTMLGLIHDVCQDLIQCEPVSAA